MKINKISFKDNVRNWELSETTLGNLTLLVGASGVGKTKILNVITTIRGLTLGGISRGIEWYIEFTINENSYIWSGKTDLSGDAINLPGRAYVFSTGKDSQKPHIEKEQILLNGNEIISRTTTETIYKGQPTVKFAPTESIVSILKEEDVIKPICDGFDHVFLFGTYFYANDFTSPIFEKGSDYSDITLEELRNKGMLINTKLYLASLYHKGVFEEIKSRYCEIFPLVDDIQILTTDTKDYYFLNIQIREKGVEQWIDETEISSGMYKVLIYLAEIHLCADGSIFMIDEFENSLGINCIDELTDELLLSSNRDIQFIITSHHPYIINNIDFSYWKLVTREGSVVKTNPITNLIHGESSHDKFMQLIQLSQYQTGKD